MGFETSLFLDQPVRADLLCSLCNDVLDDPRIACDNGHVFCAAPCLDGCKQHNQPCPICRSALLESLPPNRQAQSMIMEMRIKCENHDAGSGAEENPPAARRRTDEDGASIPVPAGGPSDSVGCKWEGTVSEFIEHIKACPFKAELLCPLGCGKRIDSKLIEQHTISDCSFREVNCSKCQERMPAYLIRSHQNTTCPKAIVSCRYCNASMPRKKLGTQSDREFRSDSVPAVGIYRQELSGGGSRSSRAATELSGHYLECPRLPLRCEFYDLGCPAYLPRDELAAHHAQDAQHHAHLVSCGIKRAREWQMTEFRWDIACSTLAGNNDMILESPKLFSNGMRLFFKLYITGEKVEIEVLASDRNGSPAGIRNVKLSVDVLEPDESGYIDAHAKNLEKGEIESIAWSGTDDIVAFPPGPCPFTYEYDTGNIEVTRNLLVKHNPLAADDSNHGHYFEIIASFETKVARSFYHKEG